VAVEAGKPGAAARCRCTCHLRQPHHSIRLDQDMSEGRVDVRCGRVGCVQACHSKASRASASRRVVNRRYTVFAPQTVVMGRNKSTPSDIATHDPHPVPQLDPWG
jgi:hypothetical protein